MKSLFISGLFALFHSFWNIVFLSFRHSYIITIMWFLLPCRWRFLHRSSSVQKDLHRVSGRDSNLGLPYSSPTHYPLSYAAPSFSAPQPCLAPPYPSLLATQHPSLKYAATTLIVMIFKTNVFWHFLKIIISFSEHTRTCWNFSYNSLFIRLSPLRNHHWVQVKTYNILIFQQKSTKEWKAYHT
jgi:hypothetical protein